MGSFITQQVIKGVLMTCWLQERPPELLTVHFSTINHLLRHSAPWRGVSFPELESQVSLYRADWRHCCGASGPWWPWGYGMGRRMSCQSHFTGGRRQRYVDGILRPIIVPFARHHLLLLQRGNARPCVATISTRFQEMCAGRCNTQFLPGQPAHRTCHPPGVFGTLWMEVYGSSFQFLPTSSDLEQPLRRSEHSTGRHQKPDRLDAKEIKKKWQILVGIYSVDALWGGWMSSAKEICSLTHLWTRFERNPPLCTYK